MKLQLIFALTLALAASAPGQPAADASSEYQTNKSAAENFYADGSYAKAHALYAKADLSLLSGDESRWVAFRLADTQWRSEAATDRSDTTKLDEARNDLEKQIRDLTREDQHDRVWAEVQESLGDFFWTRRNNNNWGEAWPHYQAALDWWAGAPDVELARQRYLAMVWRIAKPPGAGRDYYFGGWGNYLPIEILDNALKIAQSENDKAHAHYLLAMTLRNQGGSQRQLARVPEEFEGAIAPGKTTDWYDDAIYSYGEWMMGQGRLIPLANGSWQNQPDYPKALEMFRRVVTEFKKGETRYWEQAQQQIKSITEPDVSVSAGNVFLPDSEIQYQLSWRNVKKIDLALYAVDLNRDVQIPQEDSRQLDWLHSIKTGSLEKIKSWSRDTDDKGDYKPGAESVHYDGKLKAGAYLIEASGGGKESRDLILVSDAALVLKSSGRQALAYFCNALDSSPLGSAKVSLWEEWWEDNRWHARSQTRDADTNGIAVFDLTHIANNNNVQLFASAVRDDRQAFSFNNSYWNNRNQDERWRIYAFTDRPAYRPKETVNWKFIARRYDGSVYSTPAEQSIHYRILAPDNSAVKEAEVKLNAFGSAAGALDLTETMRLGEYRVIFWDQSPNRPIGEATLFRLEEYKLPEFKVEVKTPEENGQKKTFRLGDKVEVSVQADYYFGGPVSDAGVEVLVYQNPFWHIWHEPRPYPWLYSDLDENSPFGYNRRYYGGGQQIIKRETVKTDATGKATLTFDTPENQNQDFEYRIEARVTDSSRREITGTGTVRVTRQRYYVYAEPAHSLYQPQDKVTVNFKALDANEQPVKTDGSVKVTRDYWYEIWLAPDGHEVKGGDLKALQTKYRIWPPPPDRPDQKNWRLKFRGYEHDDILTRSLATDTNGEAQLDFTPAREGYYRIAWTSDDTSHETIYATFTNHVTADTTVWVCTDRSTDLGYRHGGVEIIADKDTFRVGQVAPVMLVSRTPDRYVLFSVEGEDLYNYQLVHLDGTVKLVNLPVEEKHVPNIFLDATLVDDRQIFTDTKQIVVPPTKNFLTVDVKPDRSQYQPRDEGTFIVTTKNGEGKPVSAEVALSLVDQSVFYIQGDYAGDPRQFFFGEKRQHPIQTQSTMNQKSYTKLVPGDNGQLIDEQELERQKEIERNRVDYFLRDGAAQNELAAGKDFNGAFGGTGVLFGGGAGGGGGGIGSSYRAVATDAVHSMMPATAMPTSLEANGPVAQGIPMMGALRKAAVAGRMPAEEPPAVVVRSDFRSTVFWQPDIVTDKNGTATVKVKYPDSLTTWKATARAATESNQFGIAETNTVTKQPLIVRLEAPRFFVVGDTVTISAVVNNNTGEPANVMVSLVCEPQLKMKPATDTNLLYGGRFQAPDFVVIKVPANGEARADWVIEPPAAGELKLKASARDTGNSHRTDAMEKTFTVYEHGIEKFIAKSGKARGSDITVKLDLPPERKPGSTSLSVQVTPSMAVTMLDALPYLADYPYGCTEQTMSRFLPAVITAKTLRDLGLQPEDIMGRAFGGIETNSAAATHPNGKKNLEKLTDMTDAALKRLYDFQHGDGGWGWWKEGDSDHWMTAYVVWGMSLARDAGVEVKQDALRRAATYLDEHLVEEEENPDMQAWMLHAYAAYEHNSGAHGKFTAKAAENLWNHRDDLNAYTRALFALAEHDLGDSARAKTLVENLANGVKRDDRPDTSILISGNSQPSTPNTQPSIQGTAHWGEDGIYWRWSDGGVEATAFALRAMLEIDPTNQLIEPVTNWLIKNRRGAQWNSTRDTAIVVLALNDYLRASGELKGGLEYEVFVNDKSIAKKKITSADVFSAPSRFTVDPKLIRDSNSIRIVRKSGDGPIYFAAEAKFFSTEEPIAPAGNEIFVKREYYKLAERPTLLKGLVYDREPLRNGDTVKSGERVQTALTIEGKNNYEYLLFEDLKPAGLEAVEVRSGESLYARELKSSAVSRKFAVTNAPASQAYVVKSGDTLTKIARANRTSVATLREENSLAAGPIRIGQRIMIRRPPEASDSDYTGRTRWVYQELRDRKVALFIDKLPEGVWEIRYDFRAEVPGKFHALPVIGQAMYVPEIRANSAELRINVEDQEK
ncbi:MAG TPA: alpha-2-macroglobulin family protein [Verrucomicrobiae bacterium]|nr:alpha-2-macroglobulin family protein [Verrucomicrobiae bacterium]